MLCPQQSLLGLKSLDRWKQLVLFMHSQTTPTKNKFSIFVFCASKMNMRRTEWKSPAADLISPRPVTQSEAAAAFTAAWDVHSYRDSLDSLPYLPLDSLSPPLPLPTAVWDSRDVSFCKINPCPHRPQKQKTAWSSRGRMSDSLGCRVVLCTMITSIV